MIRLEKILTWCSAISYDESHVINEYIATLTLHNGTDDDNQQSVAYERMKWWMHHAMSDSILLDENDPLLSAYKSTRQRVLVLPSEPVDHLVAIMLYLKLNAIMEGRLIIDEIKLSSDQGDHMCYLYSEYSDGAVFDIKGWWNDPRPAWKHKDATQNDSNIVELNREFEWTDVGLGWDQDKGQDSNVVHADFGKK